MWDAFSLLVVGLTNVTAGCCGEQLLCQCSTPPDKNTVEVFIRKEREMHLTRSAHQVLSATEREI